jgi:hypothetical protein
MTLSKTEVDTWNDDILSVREAYGFSPDCLWAGRRPRRRVT